MVQPILEIIRCCLLDTPALVIQLHLSRVSAELGKLTTCRVAVVRDQGTDGLVGPTHVRQLVSLPNQDGKCTQTDWDFWDSNLKTVSEPRHTHTDTETQRQRHTNTHVLEHYPVKNW